MTSNIASAQPIQRQVRRLPGEYSTKRELDEQSQWFSENTLLIQTLDGIPDSVLILNEARQVIFANRALMDFVGVDQRQVIYGLRPGEVFNCTNAVSTGRGCGATRFCRTCGAAQAIINGLQGIEDSQECRIVQVDGSALDLQVTTKPLEINGQRFTLFTLQDISHLKRQLVLERLFFHDILNTAGLLKGYADIIDIATPEELEIIKARLKPTATRLINEIEVQRLLNAAENDLLAVQWMSTDACALLEALQLEYTHHEVAVGRSLQIVANAESLNFLTDTTLLGRVLSNLIKNALEASAPGQVVTLKCTLEGDMVEFSVHNVSVMPEDVQLQIFQRSFSTKGKGRGVGAYSAKLLTERYLRGTLRFTSHAETGTTFTACYPLNPLPVRQTETSPALL